MRFTKQFQLDRGTKAPWYMGFAWYDQLTDCTIILPIPFNHIAALLRVIYFRLRCPSYPKIDLYIGKKLREAYHNGYQGGYRDGQRSKRSDMADALAYAFSGIKSNDSNDEASK